MQVHILLNMTYSCNYYNNVKKELNVSFEAILKSVENSFATCKPVDLLVSQ